MKIALLPLLFVCIISCTDNRPLITKEYIVNPRWGNSDNSFGICRMKLKDSSEDIDLEDPTEAELYYGLIKDTSFSFVANIKFNGEDFSKRKVYFNRNNGFVWTKSRDVEHDWVEYKTIGELQHDSWYLLMGLGAEQVFHYVYIDSLDSVHVYRVSTITNI